MKNLINLSVFVFLNLFIFKLFPAEGKFQEYFILIIFLVINPILYVKMILKDKSFKFGLVRGDFRNGLVWSLASLFIGLVVFYIVFNYIGVVEKYNISEKASESFSYFIYYEFILVLFLSLVYEFFFRGFLMMQFTNFLGYFSILFQWAIFIILLVFNTSFNPIFIPYIIFFPLAGLIAYKSKSIFYSLIAQTVFIFLIDIIIVKISS